MTRKEVVNDLRNIADYFIEESGGAVPMALEEAINIINNMSEREKGHWIENDGYQICSNCGEEHCWEDYRASFCDCCGADMRQREDEDVPES